MKIVADSLARCKRSLLHDIAQTGADHETVLSHTYENDRQRWRAWMCDALYQALCDYERGDMLTAFRGLLLVREYLGRHGGFYPFPTAHDATIALQNALEDAFR